MSHGGWITVLHLEIYNVTYTVYWLLITFKDKDLHYISTKSIMDPEKHICWKPDIFPGLFKPLKLYFPPRLSQKLSLNVSCVFGFFSSSMHVFVFSLCVCSTLFVCSTVLQKGPGGFLHRLLVSNRAQHTLRLPGEDTNSGETAWTCVHVIHLSWTEYCPFYLKFSQPNLSL